MKLKLSKKWYEEHAKIEETCQDMAAGASLRSIAAQNKSSDSRKTIKVIQKASSRKVSKSRRSTRRSKSILG